MAKKPIKTMGLVQQDWETILDAIGMAINEADSVEIRRFKIVRKNISNQLRHPNSSNARIRTRTVAIINELEDRYENSEIEDDRGQEIPGKPDFESARIKVRELFPAVRQPRPLFNLQTHKSPEYLVSEDANEVLILQHSKTKILLKWSAFGYNLSRAFKFLSGK